MSENKHQKDKNNELILVVPKTSISGLICQYGISVACEKAIKELIEESAIFIKRGLAEEDPNFKQIIPYLIFRYNNQLFLMQRSKSASESRLASKHSLGIGGHLRKEDMDECDLFSWTKREFAEEVNCSGEVKETFVGLINDESSLVGQVHLGLFWILDSKSSEISIKSEMVFGQLTSLDDCLALYDKIEPWGQMALDYFVSEDKKKLIAECSSQI